MPYSKIADLPKSVTDNLPTHCTGDIFSSV